MKISELIAQLNELPPDNDVYLYVEGSRITVDSVDESFVEYGFIDLNAGEKQ
jgi:hypothetical protein